MKSLILGSLDNRDIMEYELGGIPETEFSYHLYASIDRIKAGEISRVLIASSMSKGSLRVVDNMLDLFGNPISLKISGQIVAEQIHAFKSDIPILIWGGRYVRTSYEYNNQGMVIKINNKLDEIKFPNETYLPPSYYSYEEYQEIRRRFLMGELEDGMIPFRCRYEEDHDLEWWMKPMIIT